MKPFQRSFIAALLLSSLLVPGCSHLSSNRLSGDWEITSADSLLNKLGQSKIDDGKEADAEDQRPKMLLQFRANGSLKTMTSMGRVDSLPKEGKWEQISFDPSKNIMQIKCTIGPQITEHEVRFIEPDLIELVPPNMAGTNTKVRFKRIK